MKEKLKSELKETSYSKINVAPLLSIVGIVVVIGFFLALPESEKKPKPPPPVMDPGQLRQSTWSEYSGRLLPMGVWSDWNNIGPGCRVDLNFDKEIHRVQYRYYSNKIMEYQHGTAPNMSSFRFMILNEGQTQAPYRVFCK